MTISPPTIPTSIDIFIYAGTRDIHLLRHCLEGLRLFSKLNGLIHIMVWRSDDYLLKQIALPDNLRVHYKDDVAGLIDDDYRNQAYVKLLVDHYITTDFYWMIDSDFLLCRPLEAKDFFDQDGKPYWFYAQWQDNVAQEKFRDSTDKFVGWFIPYQFQNHRAQFFMNRHIVQAACEKFNLSQILTQPIMPNETIAYGAFAYQFFHNNYHWIEVESCDDTVGVTYNVNQRPPSYLELDPAVTLASLPHAQCYIFWSHWELADQKMVEFLRDAVALLPNPPTLNIDTRELLLHTSLDDLRRGKTYTINGLHLDGWVQQTMQIVIDHVPMNTELYCNFLSLDREPTVARTKLTLTLNNQEPSYYKFDTGDNSIFITLEADKKNHLVFCFKNGIEEPQTGRKLYARLLAISLKEKATIAELKQG